VQRNDPCHCGSGRKYKKCHYIQDTTPIDAQAQVLIKAGVGSAQSGLTAELKKDLWTVVVPICRVDGGRVSFLGTGFFISTIGLFATAKHVLMDVVDRDGKPEENAGIIILQFMPDGNTYYQRGIIRFHIHPLADVAVGVPAPMHHKETKQPLVNRLPVLTRRIPLVGESAITYAYPKTLVTDTGAGQRIDLAASDHLGQIEEYLPNGRDKVLLPSACFRTSIEILGGASGGPVFDNFGRAFGINSTGFDGTNISYVSSIRDILAINITDVNIPHQGHFATIGISRLAELGHVVFDQ